MRRYRLTFDSGIGIVTWDKTAEELLAPNGSGSLLDFMLQEADLRGTTITLAPLDYIEALVKQRDALDLIAKRLEPTDMFADEQGQIR